MRRYRVMVAVMLATASCTHDFEPPDRAARVAAAAEAYSPALFDSVSWSDSETRIVEGNAAYAIECRKCHGFLGQGDTEYARGRQLSAPSLVKPDWPLNQVDSLRRAIYIGHESGMPVYGDGKLTIREIDATAAYIVLSLRPDVLGSN